MSQPLTLEEALKDLGIRTNYNRLIQVTVSEAHELRYAPEGFAPQGSSTQEVRERVERAKERAKISAPHEYRQLGKLSDLLTNLRKKAREHNAAVQEAQREIIGNRWTEWGQRRLLSKTYGPKLLESKDPISPLFDRIWEKSWALDDELRKFNRADYDILGGYPEGSKIHESYGDIDQNAHVVVQSIDNMWRPSNINVDIVHAYRNAKKRLQEYVERYKSIK